MTAPPTGATSFTRGYIQDEWRPFSNLTLRGGVRVEYYQSGRPAGAEQPCSSSSLYGFSNSQNLDGKVVVMPRVGLQLSARSRTS